MSVALAFADAYALNLMALLLKLAKPLMTIATVLAKGAIASGSAKGDGKSDGKGSKLKGGHASASPLGSEGQGQMYSKAALIHPA